MGQQPDTYTFLLYLASFKPDTSTASIMSWLSLMGNTPDGKVQYTGAMTSSRRIKSRLTQSRK
jgi:hypothetical protein